MKKIAEELNIIRNKNAVKLSKGINKELKDLEMANSEFNVEVKYLENEFNKNGFAGIKKNEKWGVINSDGKVVIEPVYNIDSNKPNFVGKYYELNKEYGSSYFVCDI